MSTMRSSLSVLRRLSSSLPRRKHCNHPSGLLLSTQAQARLFSSNDRGFELDQVCELAASNLRFGPGATAEVGQDLAEHFRCQRIAIFTDPNIARLDCMRVLLQSLEDNKLDYFVYDQVRIEPNDRSFQHAIDFLSNQENGYDGVVALGGGSVIDTAKAANLYACHPPKESFYDYVNPPLGRGKPIPGPVKPLIAIPTTAGTGSETTGVCIFDDTATKSKTGIANRHLKPALGIVDPNNTVTLPGPVAKYSGLDVLCHAIESYTALPFSQRPKPTSPVLRPAYQGSNPISDVWSLFALRTTAEFLTAAVNPDDPQHDEARAKMLLASSAAGMGFGNAGGKAAGFSSSLCIRRVAVVAFVFFWYIRQAIAIAAVTIATAVDCVWMHSFPSHVVALVHKFVHFVSSTGLFYFLFHFDQFLPWPHVPKFTWRTE
jgi:hydroxyacid-oxoacid transhydrogenase